ncbi:alpha/beta fold hydrolase [Tsukamurella sp. 8F]|uniref:alpha/beta fold hydrolase n=1 Tax=unclassified Tsukamurella TaxID=2633480 RepID=UPI0023B9413E|nr:MULTISPECIES: alpha/beta fold hydrolase [unclassified Tsukamurella]MDF0531320.1 alpha/beta fold hydrolase [Tsukamurella sp. 8J]MDF0588526.1 alpha/beta fold hydrolase [Tsukamurella sp. 8F]
MSFATASDGAQLWYHVHPATVSGADRATLLIAGQSLGAKAWHPVVDAFRVLGPVVTYDHRGVGRSDDRFPDGGWSTRYGAQDAASVLDAAGIASAGVYGFSMGGRIAQWLAVEHPVRVSRLVLGATTVGDRRGVPLPEEALRILMRSDRRKLLEMFFTPGWLDADPPEAGAVLAAPRSLRAQRQHFGASMDHDAFAALSTVEAPTLVLHGADDPMCLPDNARILADAVGAARVVTYPGMRHGYYLEEPRATPDAVGFLAG